MSDQQEVVIVDASGNEHVFPAGFNPKHAAAIVRNGGSAALPTKPVSAEDFAKPTSLLQTAKDVGIGAVKGVGSTAANVVETMGNSGVIPGVIPSAFAKEFRNPAFDKAEQVTTASNDAQRAGKVLEGVAEVALPVGMGANAVPRAARAARNIQRVENVVSKVLPDMAAPGDVALRIQQMASRGGTEPRAVSKLVRRLTDPAQAPMDFQEGRDWYGNISRLSADEYNRLTGPIKREMGNLREAFHGSMTSAADTMGEGQRYAGAIKEYAQAQKIRSMKDALVEALKRGALPVTGAAGAAYLLGNKLQGAVKGAFSGD